MPGAISCLAHYRFPFNQFPYRVGSLRQDGTLLSLKLYCFHSISFPTEQGIALALDQKIIWGFTSFHSISFPTEQGATLITTQTEQAVQRPFARGSKNLQKTSAKPTIKIAETLTQQYIEGVNETIGVPGICRPPRDQPRQLIRLPNLIPD